MPAIAGYAQERIMSSLEQQPVKRDWTLVVIGSVLVFSAYTFLVVLPMARSVKAEIHDAGYPNTMYDLRLRMASEDSARFIDEYMPALQACGTRRELLKKSIEAVTVADGLYCEFGVATGGTINYIASLIPQKPIHGFDSFEGLPENWREGMPKGTFARMDLPRVRPNVVLHKGWFDQVLPGGRGDSAVLSRSFIWMPIFIRPQRPCWRGWPIEWFRARSSSSMSFSCIPDGS